MQITKGIGDGDYRALLYELPLCVKVPAESFLRGSTANSVATTNLHPKTQTLYPKPQTLNRQAQRLNPRPKL